MLTSALLLLNSTFIIQTLGLGGLFLIVFAESGLLIGFFLPGDSLIFTAGLFAAQGYLPLFWLIVITVLAAILGDSLGYWIGNTFGPKIFTKEDSFFFDKSYLARSEKFFAKYGGKSLVLARFTPIVRTFVPALAGVGKMRYHTFLTYNIIGAFIWGITLPLLGFFLGRSIPNIDHYILPIVIIIITISIIPNIIGYIKTRS